MAVEDVVNASKEKLEALLAPIDGGAGADISYDEMFDKVKAEVEKLTSMSGGKVDWNAISASSVQLLELMKTAELPRRALRQECARSTSRASPGSSTASWSCRRPTPPTSWTNLGPAA